jgi:Cu2+-exporting ATPase
VTQLSPEARDVAFDLASRSNHPASRCLAQALAHAGARFDPAATVREVAGKGLELTRGEITWRLGSPEWAGARDARGPLLARAGVPLASFPLREAVRPDARRVLEQLQRGGLEVWLLSGDAQDRVSEVAHSLGIPPARALGALSPDAKAEEVSRLDARDTLYLGDGVNDSLAFERALIAGTPAIDRPALAAKSDFFLLGDGIGVLEEALASAKILRATVRRVLATALLYNLLAITTCLAGLMTPLRAAVAMPVSSLLLTALTVAGLSPRRRTALQEVPA